MPTVTVSSPLFGVDCEMCLTSIKQLELTSISVVNEQGKLVYHTLVKPQNRIINYLTKYSGITEEKLRYVKKTLKDVHNDLRNILPKDAILVGHSLNSDLKAMKMMHPYVIDSSLIYNLTHCRKRRSSLKLLTKLYLKRDIQENTIGHDPSEDAKASLELVLHKLKYDIAYGDVIQGAKIIQSQHEVDIDSEKQEDTYKENEPFSTAEEGSPHAYAYSIFQVSVKHLVTRKAVCILSSYPKCRDIGTTNSAVNKPLPHIIDLQSIIHNCDKTSLGQHGLVGWSSCPE
ncbi:RNA exonuclease 5-like [Penaeus indicus]|uniref:RNA exonuclease 5-like n=1 Tax=Penaeus indicus TaxID=29960 RepID=UPI00300D539D